MPNESAPSATIFFSSYTAIIPGLPRDQRELVCTSWFVDRFNVILALVKKEFPQITDWPPAADSRVTYEDILARIQKMKHLTCPLN